MENNFGKPSKLRLAVFDFDATIINDNSDTYINDHLIKKYNAHKQNISDGVVLSEIDLRRFIFPNSVEELYKNFNWPTRMNAAFEYINSNIGCSLDEILDKLREVKIEESMKNVFKLLWDNQYEIFILSDANDLFIETILKANNLLENFKNRIITNRTYIDEKGVLKIRPYYLEFKDDKLPYDCFYCIEDCREPSICKRELLKELVEKQVKLKNYLEHERHIMYFGDGKNDYCPGLILNETDHYFPRSGYNLAKLLENNENLNRIKAKVKLWANADEIIKQMEFNC